ncbi:DNA-binding MarR family transcriptional regulator [Mycetocola sp. BIGb0189]|uniref:MarR family winged helix-turn-helix transcriptional regulator n=1 Tax=Mycetocola sp. BIGb0189 TaxID=2940604 RepID=UPI0021679FBF|nr:MarR family transcriptional regulator [Mycetocola sp. BIGb0189]MCS4276444.1 DNA-binding MarR family transcriptional regulator [Mycetocola sp. BIGb0189]
MNGAVEAWESLFRAQVGIMRRLSEDFPMGGLTMNEYDVMFTLSRQPGRKAKLRDLNRLVLLSQPSVSRLIDKLSAEGFVTKEADPDDRRGMIITLTEEGFSAYRPVARAHMRTIESIIGGALSPAEIESMFALTEKLRCPEFDD